MVLQILHFSTESGFNFVISMIYELNATKRLKCRVRLPMQFINHCPSFEFRKFCHSPQGAFIQPRNEYAR